MEQEILVYLQDDHSPQWVGRLWSHVSKGRESATFEYTRAWLKHPKRFALEPYLALMSGPHHTSQGKALFGAFGDSSPDRWGRVLMRRAERLHASFKHETPRTLFEVDYLLRVNDEVRQGALRFAKQKEGPFLHDDPRTSIPPLVNLPQLLSASNKVMTDSDEASDLKLLLAPGSSLGGARPKASVRDRDGSLAIAKFPHQKDDYNIVLWEAVALSLAQQANISVPKWRIEKIAKSSVLIVTRFDRHQIKRIPFLSAMSLLSAEDHEQKSYMDIVDAIRQYGVKVKKDSQHLWRRMVFNILISNTDDHLRNHGFLFLEQGWQLSPAYDLNPVPTDIKPRILTTSIDLNSGEASIDRALSVCEFFGLSLSAAKLIAKEVAQIVSQWQIIAKKVGLSQVECNRMTSAFVHEDLDKALSF